jgi:predicted kinase
VIVWLNGTFGAGKTTTAAELVRLVPDSRLFDPETVGYMLRDNLADQWPGDFQHWPPWRSLVAATMAELTAYTGQHLIAPQTVMSEQYLEEITTALDAAGLDVFHVLLDVREPVLRGRIEASQEAVEWRLEHVAEYQASRPWLLEAADLVVDTTELAPADTAARIAGALPQLSPAGSLGSGVGGGARPVLPSDLGPKLYGFTRIAGSWRWPAWPRSPRGRGRPRQAGTSGR